MAEFRTKPRASISGLRHPATAKAAARQPELGLGLNIVRFQGLSSRRSSFRAERHVPRVSIKQMDWVASGYFLAGTCSADPESRWPNLEPSPRASSSGLRHPATANAAARQSELGLGLNIVRFQGLSSRRSSFRAERYAPRVSIKQMDSVASGYFLAGTCSADPESRIQVAEFRTKPQSFQLWPSAPCNSECRREAARAWAWS